MPALAGLVVIGLKLCTFQDCHMHRAACKLGVCVAVLCHYVYGDLNCVTLVLVPMYPVQCFGVAQSAWTILEAPCHNAQVAHLGFCSWLQGLETRKHLAGRVGNSEDHRLR